MNAYLQVYITLSLILLQATNTCETADQVCIICKAKEGDPLKIFVDKTWGTFKTAAQCRLLLKSDRYRDITAEVNLKQEMGNARYHSKCYRNFIAVKRSSTDSQSDHPSKKPEIRRKSSMPPSDAKGFIEGLLYLLPCTAEDRQQEGGAIVRLSYQRWM